MSVKRYQAYWDERYTSYFERLRMEERNDGDWVRYEDYAALKAERDALRAALAKLDKAAMDVVYAQNFFDARLAVHYLSEALKLSGAALKPTP